MNDKLSFSVKLTLHDYRIFNYSHLFKGSGQFLIFLDIILLFSMSVFIFYVNGTTIKIENYSNLFIAIFVFLLLINLPLLLIHVNTKRIYNSDKFLKEKQDYTMFDEGIKIESKNYNTSISWDKIYKVVEYKKIIAIYIALNKAYIIPKYVIQDKLDVIRSIFNENLAPKKNIMREKH